MQSRFRQLHLQASPLRLPNAWDAGSARLIASLGAQAIATSSAGVAWSLGYRDGNSLPLAPHLAAVAAMRRVLDVPLSVDLESGYAEAPQAVAGHVARFIEAGAEGINIQDGSDTPAHLCRKIAAIRQAAQGAGVDLYINVRTDVYLQPQVAAARRVAEVLARAQGYQAAGADGLFVLGATAPDEIAAIAAGTPLLLNVIAWPGLPPVPQLAALGVRRVSTGSWLPQTLWRHTSTLAGDFLRDGLSPPLIAQASPYAAVNASF